MDPEAHRPRGTPPGTSAYLLEDRTPAEETYSSGVLRRVRRVGRMDATQREAAAEPRGVAHEKGMIPTKMQDWLEKLIPEVQRACGAPMPAHINHVLVNEYRHGEGIMPYQDGPPYTPAVGTPSSAGKRHAIHPAPRVADDGAAHPTDADVDALGSGVAPAEESPPLRRPVRLYLHGMTSFSEDRLDDSIVNREGGGAGGRGGDGTEGGDAGEPDARTQG